MMECCIAVSDRGQLIVTGL